MDQKKLAKNLVESMEYVELFLADLEADEPTIDQPTDLLNHILQTLLDAYLNLPAEVK